jgi:hypothetical protein
MLQVMAGRRVPFVSAGALTRTKMVVQQKRMAAAAEKTHPFAAFTSNRIAETAALDRLSQTNA